MSQQWWKDDDQLLAALGAALRSERTPIPAEAPIAAGRHTKNETVLCGTAGLPGETNSAHKANTGALGTDRRRSLSVIYSAASVAIDRRL
jgi:hypothetical protein